MPHPSGLSTPELSARIRAGLDRARAKGSTLGRPRRVSDALIDWVADLIEKGDTQRDACRKAGISVWTYRDRRLARAGTHPTPPPIPDLLVGDGTPDADGVHSSP